MVEPKLQVVVRGGASEPLAEQALELADRKARGPRDLAQRERVLEVLLHRADRGDELRLAHPEALVRSHPLVVVRGPDPLVHELIRDSPREHGAVRESDEVQHEIEGRGSPRAGDALAVDFEQVGGDFEARKVLGKRLDVLPMDGAPVPVEEARFGEQAGARAKAADHPSPARNPAKPCRRLPAALLVGREPRADEERLALARVRHRRVGGDRNAVARGHRQSVPGDDLPVIETAPAQSIRGIERIDGR